MTAEIMYFKDDSDNESLKKEIDAEIDEDIPLPVKPKHKKNKVAQKEPIVEESSKPTQNGINNKVEKKDSIEDKEDSDIEELSEKISSTQINEDKQTDTKEKKLTHKEKKKMKKIQQYEQQMETMLKKGGQGHSDLDSNFTVSQAQKTAGQLAAFENAVDIKVENFSISAKGNELFVNANLLIAQGRHYGLVGPNG